MVIASLRFLIPPDALIFVWLPAIAACIPLLAGVYLGSVVETGSDDQLSEWEEDIYVMGLVSENEEQE